MKNNKLILIVLMIITGAAAFFAGMKYQQSKSVASRQGAGGQFQGANRAGRAGFRPVSGSIISADTTSITVKLQDGSSKIVVLSEKTTINKAAQAKKEDLKVGEKVAVFGTENSDGSVTAQSVQLNPMLRQATNGQTQGK